MADVLSSLSCPVQTNKEEDPVERLCDDETLAVSCLSQRGTRMQQRAGATFTPIHGGSL